MSDFTVAWKAGNQSKSRASQRKTQIPNTKTKLTMLRFKKKCSIITRCTVQYIAFFQPGKTNLQHFGNTVTMTCCSMCLCCFSADRLVRELMCLNKVRYQAACYIILYQDYRYIQVSTLPAIWWNCCSEACKNVISKPADPVRQTSPPH